MKGLIKRWGLTAVGVLLSVCAAAQIEGKTAYNFMDVSGSSRIYGLGGVNISTVDGDDVMTTDQNPALLGPEMSRSIGVGYMRYVGGSNFASARFAHAAGENGAWGIGLHYFGYGSIKTALPDGTITGSTSPLDMAFSAMYSHNLSDRWRGGIALKFLYSSYAGYNALAIATDLGVNYYDEDYDSSLSLVVANLGGQVKKFYERADRLPIDVRLGWTKSLGASPFYLNITAWNLTKWHLPYWKHSTDEELGGKMVDNFFSNFFRHLVFAVEWKPSDRFYLDLAYNHKMKTDMATYQRNFFSGFSIGAGLKVRAFGIGIAFAQPHKSAATFMLNITTNLYDF
ncbi:MAG: type IX secretion system protein PorQ [Bacteroides sp.]|nr:type IX secretion system protein PorQ [Bacteroides sp.]MCM1379225.1 type IX secretion system protein PorQ [Bacteroides sp.]MCM1445117.1 type IX secretion system protein PorQ [Prevotella sp.]